MRMVLVFLIFVIWKINYECSIYLIYNFLMNLDRNLKLLDDEYYYLFFIG